MVIKLGDNLLQYCDMDFIEGARSSPDAPLPHYNTFAGVLTTVTVKSNSELTKVVVEM